MKKSQGELWAMNYARSGKLGATPAPRWVYLKFECGHRERVWSYVGRYLGRSVWNIDHCRRCFADPERFEVFHLVTASWVVTAA